MHLALSSAAEHWCWVTADMYEEPIIIGVVAVTQACCEPMLQSSTGHYGMHLALSSAAEHWCWVTADMYEESTIIGVVAVTQACCQPGLQTST